MSIKQFLLAALVGTVFADDSPAVVCNGPLDVTCCRSKANEDCLSKVLGIAFSGKCSGDAVSFESHQTRKDIVVHPAASERPCSLQYEVIN